MQRWILVMSFILLNCGTKIDVGGNGDEARIRKNLGIDDLLSSASGNGRASIDDSNQAAIQAHRQKCFRTPIDLPADVRNVCDTILAANDAIKNGMTELRQMICDQHLGIGAFGTPACAWNGATASQTAHMEMLETTSPESSEQEFHNLSVAATELPAPLAKNLSIVRLAYNDFDNFVAKGYRWLRGTKTQSPFEGSSLDDGILYRFLIIRSGYKLGFDGYARLHEISPDFAAVVNYSMKNYERFTHVSQLSFFRRIDANKTLLIRFENKTMKTQGQNLIAYKTTVESLKDSMEVMLDNIRASTP